MQKDFQKQLIKGKIAEMIFQQMWAEINQYTILPLGYERVLPGLLERSQNKILKPIRTAPDFVLIPKDEKDDNIMIVEVKFRRKAESRNKLKEIAMEQNKRWNPSYLFVASLKTFYFDRCDVLLKKGSIGKLDADIIPQKIQDKYIELLNSFLAEVK